MTALENQWKQSTNVSFLFTSTWSPRGLQPIKLDLACFCTDKCASLSQRKSSCYQFFRWACLSLKRWRRLPGSHREQLLISMSLLSFCVCVCVLTPDLCVCLITGCTSWSRGLGGRGRFDVCLHGESTSCPVFPAHIREAADCVWSFLLVFPGISSASL